jgi:hypothetical protein
MYSSTRSAVEVLAGFKCKRFGFEVSNPLSAEGTVGAAASKDEKLQNVDTTSLKFNATISANQKINWNINHCSSQTQVVSF